MGLLWYVVPDRAVVGLIVAVIARWNAWRQLEVSPAVIARVRRHAVPRSIARRA
jgi:hypothetical protein